MMLNMSATKGMLRDVLLLFCVMAMTPLVAAATKEKAEEQTCSSDMDGNCLASSPPIVECGVYMAPSTLGESTSMGMYTGMPLKKGQIINYPEIAIPLLFREWGKHVYGVDDGELWDRYIWKGNNANLESYTDTNRRDQRSVFVPGIGCTINSVLDMKTINSTHGSVYDMAGLHRSKDPGVGAFTPYHGAETNTVLDLPPGAELFADYGDFWIPKIDGAQVAFDDDMNSADAFLTEELLPLAKEYKDQGTPELWEGLWDFVKTTDKKALYTKAGKTMSMQPGSFAQTNLPRATWAEVQAALEYQQQQQEEKAVTAEYPEDEYSMVKKSVVREFIRKQSIRSLEWLQQHGYCQDHIRPGHSTIPQAGYGAFASRDLPKGTVVGFSPLVHIGMQGREILDMEYDDEARTALTAGGKKRKTGKNKDSNSGGRMMKMGNNLDNKMEKEKDENKNQKDNDDENNKEEEEDSEQAKTRHMYDLVLNYSFGHANSSVILTPYGGMVNYINHASSSLGLIPNVKVRWPDKELTAFKPYYLDKTPEQLKLVLDKIGLAFEYVALRDIKEGEEILMDYGQEWEDAWNYHVQHWTPPPNAEGYIHSSEWWATNTKLSKTFFYTLDEQQTKPYPSNLATMCLRSFTRNEETGALEFLKPIRRVGKRRAYCNIIERHEVVSNTTTASDDNGEESEDTGPRYLYTVDLITKHKRAKDTFTRVENVDGKYIYLYDRKFTTDWHLPNAFRYEMLIPDDIMPKAWLNGPPVHPNGLGDRYGKKHQQPTSTE